MNQTQLPYEILVVNDGSKDSTLSLVQDFFQRLQILYPHIERLPKTKVIDQENQGVSRARNRGIQESSGNWIAFLDGDDLWHPQKIESVYKYLEKNPDLEMFSTAFAVGSGDFRPWKKVIPRKAFNQTLPFFQQLYRRSFIATSSVVMKKNVFDLIGDFDPKLKVAEDLDLWLRAAVHGVRFMFIKEFLLFYRSHSNSITANPLNFSNDVKSVFLKYKKEAGYKLFVKRISIWIGATILTLWGQRRYVDIGKCFLVFWKNLIASPITYYF